MNKMTSALVGSLIAIMILFNGTLANAIGNYQSAVIVHSVGLMGIIIILILKGSKVKFYKSVPLYAYSAGIIGVTPILFNNIGFQHLGVSITLALGLLGQSMTSIIVDHYGLFGMHVERFNKKKFIGLALIIVGIIVMTVL